MKPPTWNEVPPELQSRYSVDGKVALADWYIDQPNNPKETFPHETIAAWIECARQKKTDYGVYGDTDRWLYEALEMVSIQDRSVAVMGSTRPWYEAITIAHGGLPTTIEYNLPDYKHPQIQEMLLTDAIASQKKFDVGISISSFEHDGLGRYGDPLNPDGDLRAMSEMKNLLNPDGILFLAVPMGLDKVVWNAHRVYGNVRSQMLFDKWEVLGTVGYDDNLLFVDMGKAGTYQPIIVLKNV